MTICAPLNTGCSFHTKSSTIVSFRVLEWSSPTDLLRDFSGSRNLRVARGQKECLSQGLLSDTERDASIHSASSSLTRRNAASNKAPVVCVSISSFTGSKRESTSPAHRLVTFRSSNTNRIVSVDLMPYH